MADVWAQLGPVIEAHDPDVILQVGAAPPELAARLADFAAARPGRVLHEREIVRLDAAPGDAPPADLAMVIDPVNLLDTLEALESVADAAGHLPPLVAVLVGEAAAAERVAIAADDFISARPQQWSPVHAAEGAGVVVIAPRAAEESPELSRALARLGASDRPPQAGVRSRHDDEELAQARRAAHDANVRLEAVMAESLERLKAMRTERRRLVAGGRERLAEATRATDEALVELAAERERRTEAEAEAGRARRDAEQAAAVHAREAEAAGELRARLADVEHALAAVTQERDEARADTGERRRLERAEEAQAARARDLERSRAALELEVDALRAGAGDLRREAGAAHAALGVRSAALEAAVDEQARLRADVERTRAEVSAARARLGAAERGRILSAVTGAEAPTVREEIAALLEERDALAAAAERLRAELDHRERSYRARRAELTAQLERAEAEQALQIPPIPGGSSARERERALLAGFAERYGSVLRTSQLDEVQSGLGHPGTADRRAWLRHAEEDQGAGPSVDVVLRVGDGLERARESVSALLAKTGRPFRLIVIDESADAATGDFLVRLAASQPEVTLIREHGGDGAAAAADATASSEWRVELRSDAIVTLGWLEALLEPAVARPEVVATVPFGPIPAVSAFLTRDGVAMAVRRLAGGDAAPSTAPPEGSCVATRRSAGRPAAGERVAVVAERCHVERAAPDDAVAPPELVRAAETPEGFAKLLAASPGERIGVAFILPGLSRGGSGGSHSVYQEVSGLRALGVDARILLPAAMADTARAVYPNADEVFVAFDDEDQIEELTRGAGVISATHFESVKLLARLQSVRADFVPAYYVQDYELFFAQPGTAGLAEAAASYTAAPGLLLFAKTHWLCNVVSAAHGTPVAKVEPSIDESVYFPAAAARPADGPLRIAAMVRPRTPRRQPVGTVAVLERLLERHAGAVEVATFGCSPEELAKVTRSEAIHERHRGLLRREDVAALLRGSDVFLDLSMYQAFGRTALEAMACGATSIVPRVGGVWEYAEPGVNALVVDTWNDEAVVRAIDGLAGDRARLRSLQDAALATARRYSVMRAAASEYVLFESEYRRRFGGLAGKRAAAELSGR